jgi:hypothetical protein
MARSAQPRAAGLSFLGSCRIARLRLGSADSVERRRPTFDKTLLVGLKRILFKEEAPIDSDSLRKTGRRVLNSSSERATPNAKPYAFRI